MVSSKDLKNRFEERVAPALGVKTRKGGYEVRPKKDIYDIDQGYGGYRLVKQPKGGTGEADLSDRYTAKEMNIYLKGVEQGALLSKGKYKSKGFRQIR